jgi:nitroreductase
MVRRFTTDPVPPDVLKRILSAIRHVPTAGFSQGIELVVLQTPEEVGRFWRITTPAAERSAALKRGDPPEGTPPVIVLPFSDKRAYLRRYSGADKAGLGMDEEEGWPVPYWDVDAAMAAMTILLAAVDEGLGGWFFGVFHGEAELLDDLGVPDGPRLIGAIGLGRPDPSDRAVVFDHREVADYVHRGRW